MFFSLRSLGRLRPSSSWLSFLIVLAGCQAGDDKQEVNSASLSLETAKNITIHTEKPLNYKEIEGATFSTSNNVVANVEQPKELSVEYEAIDLDLTDTHTPPIKAMVLSEPGIELTGDNPLYLQVGDTYDELGATAMDASSRDISQNIEIKSDLRLNEEGIISQTGYFFVRYRVTDQSDTDSKTYRTTRKVIVQQATCSDDDRDCLKLAEHHSQKISDYPNGKSISDAVQIKASRVLCTAPCGVHFEADLLSEFWDGEKVSTIDEFNEVAYHWDFGDERARFVSLLKDFRFSRSSNYAQGPYAAHVFGKAGSYEVRLKTADKTGRASEAVIDIVVEAPENQYPGDRTLCVSTTNNFRRCPSGAQRLTEWSQAAEIINFRPKSSERHGYRVLFRAGDQFPVTETMSLRDGPYLISRYGWGRNPEILLSEDMDVFDAMKTRDVTIAHLDAKGTYDPTTGAGETYRSHFIQTSLVDHLTIYRTHSSGFGMHALLTGGDALIVADNTTTNWHDYGSLCNAYDVNNNGRVDRHEYTQRAAYIGNRFRQNKDAVSGKGGKFGELPHWADHGPLRTAGSFKMVISQNDLVSTTGWSSDGQGHQPALRYNQAGPAYHSGVINQNQFSGGYHVVALSTQNPRTRAYLGHVLFERNYLLGTSNTMYMMRLSYGNSIIRNNIAVMPDVRDDGLLLPFTHMIEIGFGTSSQANMRAEKHIFGNTFVNLQSQPEGDYEPIGKSLVSRMPQNKYKATNNIIYTAGQPENSNVDISDVSSDVLDYSNLVENFEKSNNIFHSKGLFDTYTGYKRGE